MRRFLPLVLVLTGLVALSPARAHNAPQTAGPALAWVTVTPEQEHLLGGFDLAEDRRGDQVQVVLWPGDVARLEKLGLRYRITVPDLEAADRIARVGEWKAEPATARTTYRVLADYEKELRDLAVAYPDRVLHFTAPYRTLEGRDVHGVIIASNVQRLDGRPTSFVMGLHHAREWPAAELTMNFATELATGTSARIQAIRDTVRTVIIPVVNPDGFDLSRSSQIQENIDQWLEIPLGVTAGGQLTYWRKNRRGLAHVPDANLSVASYGVDPNRNYAYQWGGGGLSGGSRASSNPTDQTYQGPAPFSEPEPRNIRHIVLTNNVTTLLTNHTAADLVLWPWGHTNTPAPDATQLSALGTQMANSNHARPMQGIGLYATTGTTEDWSYATTGGFGYTFELGSNGFHPPYASNIPQLWTRYRDSFLRLVEAANTTAYHSILTGTVRDASSNVALNATLRLTKTVSTPLYLDGDGKAPVSERSYTDTLDLSMETGPAGAFTWHINPSTRPIASGTESYTLTVSALGHAPKTLTVTVARGQTSSLGTIALDAA